jgi:hypothetical protein
MSDVKAVRYLLANDASLIAAVPAAKIIAGPIPQGEALPAISVAHISTVRRNTVKQAATVFCTSRVQVTVLAKDYPTQKSVLALVRAALPRTRGTVNGVYVDDILPDIEGPDFRDDDEGIYMQSQDFIVTYNE